MVTSRSFETFDEATNFSIKLPRESVLEVKYYDNKISDTKNNSNLDGGY
jgi:hypothetical protein